MRGTERAVWRATFATCEISLRPAIIPYVPALIDVTRLTRERDVLRTVTSLVRDTLPAGWTATLGERARASEDVLCITAPDGTSADIVIEARLRADPRTAIEITSQRSDKPSFLLAARFLSPRTRQALTDSGVNYADATGNIRLALARPGLHVNLPPVPADGVKGARLTRLGSRVYSGSLKPMRDPWDRDIFWIGGGSITWSGEPDSDFRAISDGYNSITPLHLDLTNYSMLESSGNWWREL